MPCCADLQRFLAVDREKPGFMFSHSMRMPPRDPPIRINGIVYRTVEEATEILRINFCPWCGADLKSYPMATFPPQTA